MIFLIALGGALGSAARYYVMSLVSHGFGKNFPYGTLCVNILGSFIMGVMIVAFARLLSVSQPVQAMLTVGFLGGFTTFSTFSLDTIVLIERGDISSAIIYVLLSVTGSLLGVALGLTISRMVMA